MFENNEIKNPFKPDDKNGNIIYEAIREMAEKMDVSNIDRIYLDTCGMFNGYLTGKVFISIDAKSPMSDEDFDVLFDTERSLEKEGFEICIGEEHIHDALGYLILY